MDYSYLYTPFEIDQYVCFLVSRMDMVVMPGKSTKNPAAHILLTPDAKAALEALVKMRAICQVPANNPHVFARLNASTPIEGSATFKMIVYKCPNLQYPERITTRSMRKYTATVTQVKAAIWSHLSSLFPDFVFSQFTFQKSWIIWDF